MTLLTSRRGLLGMLAAGVGAAIVRPGLLMPIKPRLAIPSTFTKICTGSLDGRTVIQSFWFCNTTGAPCAFTMKIDGKSVMRGRVDTLSRVFDFPISVPRNASVTIEHDGPPMQFGMHFSQTYDDARLAS